MGARSMPAGVQSLKTPAFGRLCSSHSPHDAVVVAPRSLALPSLPGWFLPTNPSERLRSAAACRISMQQERVALVNARHRSPASRPQHRQP